MPTQTHEVDGATTVMPLELSNGEKILVEATFVSMEGAEGFDVPDIPSMKNIVRATESIGTDLFEAIQKVGPDKGAVEFGFKVSGEAGVPLVAKGKAEANIGVTLEWEKAAPPAPK